MEQIPVGQFAYQIPIYDEDGDAVEVFITSGNGCNPFRAPTFAVDPRSRNLTIANLLVFAACPRFTLILNLTAYDIDPLDWPQTTLVALPFETSRIVSGASCLPAVPLWLRL